MRILIIDDDATLRSMTAALLQRDGFETVAVRHGRPAVEAVDRAGAGDYAAIVVQVNVTPSPIDAGEPTGMALLHHMQKTKPHLISRTVVITTMARLEVAACTALVQPFDIRALLEAVRRCLREGGEREEEERAASGSPNRPASGRASSARSSSPPPRRSPR